MLRKTTISSLWYLLEFVVGSLGLLVGYRFFFSTQSLLRGTRRSAGIILSAFDNSRRGGVYLRVSHTVSPFESLQVRVRMPCT